MVLPGKRVIRGESLQPILSCARNCATPATLSSAQHNSEYLVDLINSLLDARLFSLIGPVVAQLWAGPRRSTQHCAANWVSSNPKSSVVYTRIQRLSQVVRFSRQRSSLVAQRLPTFLRQPSAFRADHAIRKLPWAPLASSRRVP